MTNSKQTTFHDVVSQLLGNKLKIYVDAPAGLVTSTDVYMTIFETLQEVFETSKSQLTNEALNYVAQEYYDSIEINGRQDFLNPNIFEKRASLKNLETRELAFLTMILKGTDFVIPVFQEIKHRS